MSTPADPSQNENTYVFEAENAAEMARLMIQDRLVTKAMGGLWPELSDSSAIHDVLDLACGPGGWVLDVAQTYPTMQVTGVDISQLMIEYARSHVMKQKLHNTSFRVMNILGPLDFPDESFDLVNARTIFGFMPPAAWPKLMQECIRILRPGGLIRLSEAEAPSTNSASISAIWALFSQALRKAGQSFSPDGRNFGIVPVLGKIVRDAGFVHIRKMAHVNDFSAGTEGYTITYQDLMVASRLIQPFLIKLGVTTQEEIDALYHRSLAEMQSSEFCGVAFMLTVIGEKPEN